MSKARSLSAFISDPAIDASEIGSNAVTTDKILDSAVTHTKLHTNMDLTSKTVTFADNHISGNKIHGGVISDFASIGIDDNASSTALTIDSSGKVGIGVASPAEELDISADAPSIQLSSTNASGRSYGLQSMNTGKLGIYDANAGLNRVVIDSSGNVGIGTVSPSANLEINPGSGGSELKITSTDNGGNNVRLIQGYNTYLNASNNVYMSAGGNTDMFNLVNGNVGIGTTNPLNAFHVRTDAAAETTIRLENNTDSGSANTGLHFKNYATNSQSKIYFSDWVGESGSIRYTHQNDTLTFNVNNADRWIINSAGDLKSNTRGAGFSSTSYVYSTTVSPTSAGGGTAIYDIFLPSYIPTTDAMDLELIVHSNPNGGGSGSYRQLKRVHVHCMTGWHGSGYTPFLEWDAISDYMSLGFTVVIYYNGNEFTTSIDSASANNGSLFWGSGGVYLRVKVWGFNSTYPGHQDLALILGHRS